MRILRTSLISYSAQRRLQGCMANQWKMNELSKRNQRLYASVCTFTKYARAGTNAVSI